MAVKEKAKPKNKKPVKKESPVTLHLEFKDNALLGELYGEQDVNLEKIENKFGVSAISRGNQLALTGAQPSIDSAREVLESLYAKLKNGQEISTSTVDAALRMVGDVAMETETEKKQAKRHNYSGDVSIKTMRKTVTPYSHIQAEYFQALYDHNLTFALGPAGTGKTYIAVAMAVYAFINKKVDRIILSRPAVEAGEKLGFLPGDLKEKVDPFLRPLYDALYDMLPAERVVQAIETGEIEVAPLAFMRGRTLSNAYVILDEAQNTTPTQMKMFLTRMGENSQMCVTGDLSQCDLPRDIASGLRDAVKKLEGIEGISTIRFGQEDVVRHPLAARIVKAYDEWDKREGRKPENE